MNPDPYIVLSPHHNAQHSVARSFASSSLHLSRLSQISFQQPLRPAATNPIAQSTLSIRQQDQQPNNNVSFQHLSDISQQSIEHSLSSYRNFSVENSLSQEANLQITAFERQTLLTKTLHCAYLFKAFQFLFFTLSTCSLTLYTLLWTQQNTINFYVLITLFQNGYHSLFLTSELIPMVSLFHYDLQYNHPNALISSFFRQHPMGLQLRLREVLAFFLNRKGQQVVINTYLYIGVFIIGCLEIANPLIPLWFKFVQLSLGLLIVLVFMLSLIFGCVMLPFWICYIQYHYSRNRGEVIQMEAEDERFELPSATRVEEGSVRQPCYICLQEYEKGELVVRLPCGGQHVFHQECIEPWSLAHNHCPVCRQVLP